NNVRLVYQSRDGLSSVSHNVCPHAIDRYCLFLIDTSCNILRLQQCIYLCIIGCITDNPIRLIS
ncbi:hypothetical protein, partial [Myroides odoratimimus]